MFSNRNRIGYGKQILFPSLDMNLALRRGSESGNNKPSNLVSGLPSCIQKSLQFELGMLIS